MKIECTYKNGLANRSITNFIKIKPYLEKKRQNNGEVNKGHISFIKTQQKKTWGKQCYLSGSISATPVNFSCLISKFSCIIWFRKWSHGFSYVNISFRSSRLHVTTKMAVHIYEDILFLHTYKKETVISRINKNYRVKTRKE